MELVQVIGNNARFRFADLFSYLSNNFAVETIDYVTWRTALMDFTLSSGDSALFPLLHFVLDDLPTSTKSPELDDTNTREVLQKRGVVCKDMHALMPIYLGYLCAVEFLAPTPQGLPSLEIWESAKGLTVSRSLQ
jgi:L-2-aminoadipate reductase